MEAHLTAMAVLPLGAALWDGLAALAGWILANSWWLALLTAAALIGWEHLQRRLSSAALSRRTYLQLEPTPAFEPDAEQIWRQGMQLVRAAGSGPWWTPRWARSVRVRLRADGKRPLVYRIEAPSTAQPLLKQTPYGPRVEVKQTAPVADKQRAHVVRAVLTLHGEPGSRLREVPLDPDPLQPLIDAVADLNAELGDVAEVCVTWPYARCRPCSAPAARPAGKPSVRPAG
ncbi:hypothetical protein [Streptomyces katrae]|uniref:hypothetical protein n=1 Tax=Streptomyces katrae TaxID=68223 RepID=UPI000B004937|nr:hypothetical protein [Streptomyces katrae]